MDAPAFAQLFPRLYHLTFLSNLESIRQYGLLSARDLADRLAFPEDERLASVTLRRRCIQTLQGVTLRDQAPMQEAKMKSCLVKITIPEWIALMNSKVFFFLSREKALAFAETYAAYDNLLLEVDTAALLARHAEHTALCRISPGDFLHRPQPRGRDSFIPLAAFAYKKKRDTPAELTLDVPIPDILQIATFLPLPSESDRP